LVSISNVTERMKMHLEFAERGLIALSADPAGLLLRGGRNTF
jgi:hypothetical protein